MRLLMLAVALLCLSAAACRKPARQELPSGPDEMAWRLFAQANSQQSLKPAWLGWTTPGRLVRPSPAPSLEKWRDAGHSPDIQNMLYALETIKNREELISALRKFDDSQGGSKTLSFYNPPLVTALSKSLNGDPKITLLTPEGRQFAFQSGAEIDLGSSTTAIKVQFQIIPEQDNKKYFLFPGLPNFGAVAFHLTSRILSQWVWATWEQVTVADEDKKNGGYCCSDSWGWDATAMKPSTQLLDMLKANGADSVWGENYRLVGTQVYATDSIGRPTLLGNYYLEDQTQKPLSCITCHARAAYDANDVALPVVNEFNKAYIGKPLTEWFRSGDRLTNLQFDFLWGVLAEKSVESRLKAGHLDLFNLQ